MKIERDKLSLKKTVAEYKTGGRRIGFVPTMGALHAGHLSLIRLAQEKADKIVVSIFVNPAQFAPGEDFEAYPRNVEADLKMLEDLGADLVYLPDERTIYPDGQESNIQPGPAAEGLESDFRPHFFGGVLNVVNRLFDHVRPNIAVFGEKDYQQLMVIREFVKAEDLPIELMGGPIIRDTHGLALSSRNAYLREEELTIARQLNVVLKHGGTEQDLLNAGFEKVDYVAERWNRRLAAGWVGQTRLIDNIPT